MPDVEATARMAVPDHVSRVARLRLSSLGLVSMLIIQFILGMIYSLYGTGPTATKSVGMFSSPVLALHVIFQARELTPDVEAVLTEFGVAEISA